jgi:hypothetical protein
MKKALSIGNCPTVQDINLHPLLFILRKSGRISRTKEVGIREVPGATVSGLVTLISKDFSQLVMIAFVVSAPFVVIAGLGTLQVSYRHLG